MRLQNSASRYLTSRSGCTLRAVASRTQRQRFIKSSSFEAALKRRADILIQMELLELMIRGPRGPTRLAQAANLNYQRCEEILSSLIARQLILKTIGEGRETYSATPKGIELFMRWERFYEELNLP